MSGMREYVISVSAAAMTAGLLTSLTDPKTTVGILLRTMAGLFLLFTLLGPVTDLDFGEILNHVETLASDGDAAVSEGRQAADQAEMAYIKDQVAAYILDKAKTYGADIKVDVTLDSMGIPVSARIEGRVSPYVKQILREMMETQLGIAKEDQQWI